MYQPKLKQMPLQDGKLSDLAPAVEPKSKRAPLREAVAELGFSYFQPNGRALGLLKEFKTLKANWDEEGALPPSPQAIRQAEYLVRLLKISGQKVFHVAPGPNGEVMVDLREKGKSVEILFYPDRAKFVQFPAVGSPKQGEFIDSQLPEILKWLHE